MEAGSVLVPYVKKERRSYIRPHFEQVAETEGELNFQITVLLDAYTTKHGLHYDRMGDCTSACTEAAAEFRRRIMADYEDAKIRENGDVYSPSIFEALDRLEPF